MIGSGCKNCPVKPCYTLHYRGSYCAEQRAKHGLGGPRTNADKIRAMTDEELASEMFIGMECGACPCADKCGNGSHCKDTILEWLQQPAEVSE